jgi:hypothetical protein
VRRTGSLRTPWLRSLWTLLLLLVAAACTDEPTSAILRPGAPAPAISDGAAGGNKNFFFLPPIAADPSRSPNYRAGEFNARLSPTIEICRLPIVDVSPKDGRCDVSTVVARWGASAVTLSVAEELYQVTWRTDSVPLIRTVDYRIRVLVGDTELGFADVDPVTKAELRNYKRPGFVPVEPGRTLPIKFRIQNGVLAGSGSTDYVERTVPATGGADVVTVVVNGVSESRTGTLVRTAAGHAAGFFPNGWLPPGVASVDVSIARVPVPPGQTATSCHNTPGLVEFEGCYQYATYPTLPFRTDDGAPPGTQFYKPVVVEMCTTLPETDPRYDALSLFKSRPNERPNGLTVLKEVAPVGFIECEGFGASQPQTTTIGLRSRGPATVLARAAAAWRATAGAAWGGLAAALTPRSAYAIDLGMGGEALSFSNIGFGIRQTVQPVGPTALTSVAGVATAQVRVVAQHDHVHNGEPEPIYIGVPGVPVVFTVTSGGGTVASGALAGTTVTVVSNDSGFARAPWTLGGEGTNALTASIMNGAAFPYGGSTTVAFTGAAGTAPPPAPVVSIGGVIRDQSSQTAIPSNVTATLTAVDGTGRTRPVSYVGGEIGSLADTLRANVDPDTAFFGRQALLTISFMSGNVAQTRTALVSVPPAVAGTIGSVVQPFTVTALSVAITGTVTQQDQTTLVPGALVRVGLGSGTTQAVAAVSDAAGAYTLYLQSGDTTAAPGTFSFFAADRPGYVTLRNVYAPITAGQNQTANLSLLANGAQGVLAQAQVRTNNPASPGAPVVGVPVVVRVDSIRTENLPGLSTTTDAWGRFRLFIPFSAVTPGRTVLYGPEFTSGGMFAAQQTMPSAATYFTTGFEQPNAVP